MPFIPAHLTRPRVGALLPILIPLAGLACGGDGGTDIVLPSLSVTTSTSGVELDPDGYSVSIDNQAPLPIGIEATLTVDRLPEGQHTVQLSGVAPNCMVDGGSARVVTVSTAATATVTFAVVCGPTSGSLEVVTSSTGGPLDPDGFVLVIDGTERGTIGVNATASFTELTAGLHTVELTGVAGNCQVAGDNPVGVAVLPGETARVSFTINCAATMGGLAVTISGLPAGTAASVTVSGPDNFSQTLTATRTVTGLVPGSYAVSAGNLVSGGTTYTPSVARPSVDVVAGATATVTVSYTGASNVTLNLRIDGVYITQSTQTYGSAVPLVAERAAYLRVFVVANESNTARPGVRVRLSRPGSAAWVRTISAPGASTPTQVQEGRLAESWNLAIPASEVRPDLSIVVELDPENEIRESNENDNRFPASGAKALAVRVVPAANIRFVRVRQTANNLEGAIESTDALIDLARRIYPLNSVRTEVRANVFSTAGPLHRNGVDGWNQLLSDLEAARVVEAPDRTYFGIVKLDYGRTDGVVGLAFQELPTAVGWDDPSDAPRVVAHELGHTWGRRHAPCGGPPSGTVDGLYPYSNGQIGVYGMQLSPTALKVPTSPDIMGYCFSGPWISDYTYQHVMNFRGTSGVRAEFSQPPQPSLLIWGRIENGRPVLEPVVQAVTRPRLPGRPGPYSITGTAEDGSQLFSISFDALAVESSHGGRHFAFAVPLDEVRARRVADVRLTAGGMMASQSKAPAHLRMGTEPDSFVAERDGLSVTLRWNHGTYPLIMVRNPDTGEVLAFARGGNARVWTSNDVLDLQVSDGVTSRQVRARVTQP